jgi:hypothetical protein
MDEIQEQVIELLAEVTRYPKKKHKYGNFCSPRSWSGRGRC